jgi:hypothetical protein
VQPVLDAQKARALEVVQENKSRVEAVSQELLSKQVGVLPLDVPKAIPLL